MEISSIKREVDKNAENYVVALHYLDFPVLIHFGLGKMKEHINRHNGKPTNSRMILIASDKPQKIGKVQGKIRRDSFDCVARDSISKYKPPGTSITPGGVQCSVFND